MCDQHQHAKVETWITPESSRHLSSKMVQLYPGEEIPWHTTGPDREEVIVCIYGMLTLCIDCPGLKAVVPISSGQAHFIPENCNHRIFNHTDAPAQYAYVVTKRKICPVCDGSGTITRSGKVTRTIRCPNERFHHAL